MEILNQAIISCDLMMLPENDLKEIRKDIDSIAHKLTRLSDAQRKKDNQWLFTWSMSLESLTFATCSVALFRKFSI